MLPNRLMKVRENCLYGVRSILFKKIKNSFSEPIRCPHCSYTCETRANLSRHQISTQRLRGHSQEGIQLQFVPNDYYTCDYCPFHSKRRLDIVEHGLRVHRREVFICF